MGLCGSMAAQKAVTLSGYVKDGTTGEELIGATVQLTEASVGAYTNAYGFYSLSVPPGTYKVVISLMGYQVQSQVVELTQSKTLNVEMKVEGVTTETIEVRSDANANVDDVRMSSNALDIAQVQELPALFGEIDVLKTVQLLPGVQSAGDGNAGFYVRGGSADQNLILLDEATVYNASHLLGFFSVFNADAIKDLELQKGGIPARYGGRLSSVLDIRMKEGSNRIFRMQGGIGTISSRATLEIPIVKDRGALMVSGRRTYADLFLKLSPDKDVRNNQLFFYDLNLKGNYKLSEKDRLYLSGYFGRDVFKNQDIFGLHWGNGTGTLRWNHLFSDKLFANVTLIYSDFRYGFNFSQDAGESAEFLSRVQDTQLKLDFSHFIGNKSTLYYGGSTIYHYFTPGIFKPVGSESFFNELKLDKRYALESAAYIDHEWKPTARWAFRYGLRTSHFRQLGPANERTYQADGRTPVDTLTFTGGQGVKDYLGLEPRVGLRYKLNEQSSLKASYNRMYQYMHLVSNSSSPLPTDLWIPSSYNIAPQYADQIAAGYFRNLLGNKWEFSTELYYKWLHNQIDYRDNADIFFRQNLETEFLRGTGRAYGAEFHLRRNEGKLTGWISYTLGRVQRQIPGINRNEWYPANNDRRHNLAVVASWHFTERWTLAGSFVYMTGNAVTFPEGKYTLQGFTAPAYAQIDGSTRRNAARFPAYHRLDLAATHNFPSKPDSKWKHSLNISLYNAYGRKNPWSLSFQKNEDTGDTEIRMVYLFRWIPAVTWNFQFN
ncbi:MAG: TonB-dependent receptor [Bacteroidetes bacterium]|nr:TonB-dependent receptor [Bacteroidota bacterium]